MANFGSNLVIFVFFIKYVLIRKKNNLTQEKLAEKCDLSARYISYIENRKENISVDTLEKSAQSLNVESYELVKKLSN